jgi:hypothetical protein
MVPLPSEMPTAWQTGWPWLFWACWGAWLAVSDLRTDVVQPAVVRLIVGAAVLGYARPRHWWLWALALAAWIPAEPALASLLRLDAVPHEPLATWLLPPIPALAGALLGCSVARSVRPAPERAARS